MSETLNNKTLQNCYKKGYDSKINGANLQNSNYSLFSSKDRTKAWELGHKQAKIDLKDEKRC